MEKPDKIFNDLCDVVSSLKKGERFQDEEFQKLWSCKRQKVVDDIAMLTEAEYDYLEQRYKEWFKTLEK